MIFLFYSDCTSKYSFKKMQQHVVSTASDDEDDIDDDDDEIHDDDETDDDDEFAIAMINDFDKLPTYNNDCEGWLLS